MDPCVSCQSVTINGVYTHEHGCPDSWKGIYKYCLWCGNDFYPEDAYQKCCSLQCEEAYYCDV